MSDCECVTVQPGDEILHAVVECADMDDERTREVQAKIIEAGAQARHLPVVLDMTKVQFVPSLSLAALVTTLREFRQAGQRFILVGVQPTVRGTLAITHLDRLFEIYDDVNDALEQIRMPDK